MLKILQTENCTAVCIYRRKKFQREKKPRGKAVNFQWITLARIEGIWILIEIHIRPSSLVYTFLHGRRIERTQQSPRLHKNKLGIHWLSDTQVVVKIIIGHVFSMPSVVLPASVCATWFISRIILHAAAAPPPSWPTLQTPPPFRHKANTWRHFLSGK